MAIEWLFKTSVTDWFMVIITFIYVIATIYIANSNKQSALAAMEQVRESKRQFDETMRLQVMPFFQLEVSEGRIDENGSPICPYIWFEISDYKNANMSQSTFLFTIKNVGTGLAHHVGLFWTSLSKKDDEYPQENIIISQSVAWEMNAFICGKQPDSLDPCKAQQANCSLRIEYEDILGNKYQQIADIIFLVKRDSVSFVYEKITSPSLIEVFKNCNYN